MKNLLFFLGIICCIQATGQELSRGSDRLDSVTDTLQIKQYMQMAEQSSSDHPDSAIYFYQLAFQGAMRIRDKKRLANSSLLLFKLFIKAGKYEDAFNLAGEETNIGKKWHDDELQLKGHNNTAIAYQYLNDYQHAADYYLKAAGVADRMGDKAIEAKILDNMSSLFLKLKNYKMAYTYGLQSYTISRQRKDSLYMISGLMSMGDAEAGMEKYDSALVILNKAESIGLRINEILKVMLAKENKGIIYIKTQKADSAIKEFTDALTMARQNNYPYLIATALNGLANGEVLNNNYEKAERYAEKAIAMAQKQQLGSELAEMYDNMSSIKEKLGKAAEALAYRNRYDQINDSIMNIEVKTNISRMNIQYNTAKKDKEILQQKLELTKKQAAIQKRNILLLLVMVILAALTTVLISSLRSYQNKKKLHAQTVLSLQKEQEVIRLKALMEGKDEERQRISREMHDDIGSGLTSILFLSNQLKNSATTAQKGAWEKITQNTNTLISKMNEIIWSMNTDYDTLEDLVTYLRHQAGELLDSAGINYHFHIPPAIPEVSFSGEQRRNIYLVVKEALHNIIKHAGANEVNIQFEFDPAILITIRDNGKGFERDQVRRFGNGLKNMKQRMESIAGSLDITNNQGVTVQLYLPLSG